MLNVLGPLVFLVMVVAIWASYRLFMRGETHKERVAKLLPPGFKADIAHRKGDTYVGYEKNSNRIVLIDWPHGRALSPKDIRSIEPVQETMVGLVTHYWLAIDVPDPAFPRYRIWFQFRRGPRDRWLERLAEIRKN